MRLFQFIGNIGGNGIGSDLMKKMLKALKEKEYSKTSLAVQKDNYSLKMYQKVGFEIVRENTEEYIIYKNIDRLKQPI